MMDTTAIHASLGADGWREVLPACGVDQSFLKNRHGPCPACGGKDRFRFDNKGRGFFFCNNCGVGDGFNLIMRVVGCSFSAARKLVLDHAGITKTQQVRRSVPRETTEHVIAGPTQRVTVLLRESCAIEDCDAAVDYLASRKLWPLPEGHLLRAHSSVEYWEDRQRIGRYPALVMPIRDIESELVTAHVTYLTLDGRKLDTHEPRKILSPMTGRESCVAQLMKLEGDCMGIAEGIETALSAAKLAEIPVWAALNAGLLAKFEPPEHVSKLMIFPDRDVAGLDAATALMEHLQGKVHLEIRIPRAKDWNDDLRGAK